MLAASFVSNTKATRHKNGVYFPNQKLTNKPGINIDDIIEKFMLEVTKHLRENCFADV